MGKRADRSKASPPPTQVPWRSWDEYERFARFADKRGGALGPVGRVILLAAVQEAERVNA